MNDDDFMIIDYVALSKPPPTCMCNHSGEDPRVYSLVACEPNAMPAVSNVCKHWNYYQLIAKLNPLKKKKNSISFNDLTLFVQS